MCWPEERVARLTSKKYKSFWSELPLFSCPEKTRHKDMSEAMVRTIGVNMHANRPNLPILRFQFSFLPVRQKNRRLNASSLN